jgi:phage baseplate assembly protein W
MSNIDLNFIFKKLNSPASQIDSDVKLGKVMNDVAKYSDIKLDLEYEQYTANALNSDKTYSDISLIIDDESIINAVKNILTTKLYSRLLNPELNFDLRKYLFEPINEYTAYFIGYEIFNYLPTQDPRIIVEKVVVTAYINNDTYGIDIHLKLPLSSKKVLLNGILDMDGLSFN